MTVYDHRATGAQGAYYSAPYQDSDIQQGQGPRAASLVNWLGGVASLALLGGLALWSYNLVLRDVTGVPVIRVVDERPMRVAPENPGGTRTDYQGLSVNQVQADGVAGEAPAQIMLAPRPLDLSDATPPSDQMAALPEGLATEAQVVQAVYTPEPEPQSTGQAVDALISQIVAEDRAEDVVPVSVPGVARSPRPLGRPQGFRTASLGQQSRVDVTAPPAFVDPAEVPAGASMVQFKAYPTEEAARADWSALHARFGEFMAGKAPVIQPSNDGSNTFYRLRMTGFADMAEARRFCSVFLAADKDCVPFQF